MSFGVALSVKSDLGTTPISCIPNVLSFAVPLSLGTITVIFNMLLILIQIIILRSNFEKIQLMQIVVTSIFGYFIDFALDVLSFIVPTTVINQWIVCIISCFVIALGVLLEVNSNAVVLPGEGVSLTIKSVTDIEFGKLKTAFDTSNVIIGVILSLALYGTFRGIGLGTIFAGIVVGYIVRFYRNIFRTILTKIKS
ncbi:YczE/YyaS/YitT family protein [Methanosphaera sp.]